MKDDITLVDKKYIVGLTDAGRAWIENHLGPLDDRGTRRVEPGDINLLFTGAEREGLIVSITQT